MAALTKKVESTFVWELSARELALVLCLSWMRAAGPDEDRPHNWIPGVYALMGNVMVYSQVEDSVKAVADALIAGEVI